jgi:hypothetical protein
MMDWPTCSLSKVTVTTTDSEDRREYSGCFTAYITRASCPRRQFGYSISGPWPWPSQPIEMVGTARVRRRATSLHSFPEPDVRGFSSTQWETTMPPSWQACLVHKPEQARRYREYSRSVVFICERRKIHMSHTNHHKRHRSLFGGFNCKRDERPWDRRKSTAERTFDPSGQLKAAANSGMFESVPSTRYCVGE